MNVSATLPEEHAWIIRRTQCALTPHARGIKAVDRQGQIRGMVVFDYWTNTACQAHLAIDTPIALRALLHPLFNYLFVQCKRELVWGIIPSHNKTSLRLMTHLGLDVFKKVRDGWDKGDDLILLEMRRKDCRWITTAERKAA